MDKSNGFIIGNEENRQHINLSKYALYVIEGDMVKFDFDKTRTNKSGFLNLILSNYHDNFSFNNNPVIVEDELKAVFQNKELRDMSFKHKNHLIEGLIEIRKHDLVNKMKSYEKGGFYKFKINKSNAEFLRNYEDSCYFKDKGLGFYLAAIFEEYTRLPIVEREKIIFKEVIEEINNAIESKRAIKVSRKNLPDVNIVPYKIDVPYGQNSNKLVGVYDSFDRDYFSTLFDEYISNISKVKVIKSRRVTIDKDLIEEGLEATRGKRLPEEVKKFRIKFTKNGLKMYDNDESNRPLGRCETAEDLKERIYTFNCLESEIFYYFLKFGPLATILEPIDLKEKFASYYKLAYERYCE